MKNDFVFYYFAPLLVQSNNYHAANREDEETKIGMSGIYITVRKSRGRRKESNETKILNQ